MLVISILMLGIVSRLVVHLPDFTPIIALALFRGAYLQKKYALIVPLLLMLITDVILGFHNTMFFTWGSIFLISFLGMKLMEKKNFMNGLCSSLASVLIFFVITNFGVWLVSGMYAHTWQGLTDCFVLALPFLKNSLFSTLIYTALLFGAYEFAAARLKSTRFAHVL